MRKAFLIPLLTVVVLLLAGAALIYSGVYNVAADERHWSLTSRFFETLRLRSIQRQARDVAPPDLSGDDLAVRGAVHYAQMCVMCHLAPGVENTELRQGLYPQPPDLTRLKVDPAAAFWVIKHGIKMSAMPAWGTSHDDETLWTIVAFVDRLPRLTPQQYKMMVEKALPDEGMSHGLPPNAHTGGHDAHTHAHRKEKGK
jgi:mono/diheme cytochrome c family protein